MPTPYKPRRRKRYRYIHIGVSKYEDYKVDKESGKAKWHYMEQLETLPSLNTAWMMSNGHEFEHFNPLRKSQMLPMSYYLARYKPIKKDEDENI